MSAKASQTRSRERQAGPGGGSQTAPRAPRSLRKTLLTILGLCGLCLGIFVGCAQDLPDIDRTQPRGLKKSLFRSHNADNSLREWYFRQTVIEVPYGSAATFIGEQGNTEKIVWEVTERTLYAYRSREYVKNTDAPAQRPNTGEHQGSAIAAYRIESHFDITRTYNPATGEQTNVIVENTTDRPWDKREYFRVDFSNNLITDFSFVASQVLQQPVGYAIPETELDNQDRAKLTEKYIDIVNKVFIQPEINELYSRYFGRPIPSCLLYSTITKDCLGQTIKIRSSFMLAKETGYSKKEYDNNRMSKFGYFRQTNYAYHQGHGVLEKTTSRVINRWNIWQEEDKCAKPGERLSHANCKIKQIPYHLNEDFPAELKPGTANVIAQWNQQFRDVVKTRSGKDQGDVFVYCPNNPVKDGDPGACGEAGTNPQIGDLRYNFIYWVSRPHRYSPLGYGPSAADPVTGEIFNANAFIYGAALDRYSTYATDLVRMINGDLQGEDVANAQKMLDFFNNLNKLKDANHGHDHTLTQPGAITTKDTSQLKVIADRLHQRIQDGRQSFDWVSANLQRLSTNPNNAALLAGDPFKAFGLQQLSPSGQIDQTLLDKFGPQVLASRAFFNWGQQRLEKLSGRNIFMADFMDDGLLARALKLKKEMAATGGKVDYKKVYDKVRADIYLAVTLHEVGHNMGLRHNFAASADALNYQDDYWKLRAETAVNGAIIPFFRYDETNQQKLKDAIEKGMHEHQYSSIMDYGANFASDLHGLGKYDRAAILYGYGDLVEVFKPGVTQLNRDSATKALTADNWHYTQLPRLVAGDNKPLLEQIKALGTAARTIATLKELQSDKKLIEVPYQFCSDEYHHGASNCNRFDQGADPYERVKDMTQRYWSYYVFNAFKRDRVEFGMDTNEYLSRIYTRYFLPITHQYKHFVNDGLIVRRGVTCGDSNKSWDSDDRCGMAGFMASTAGLNFFSRILQTPDVGCYERTKTSSDTKYTKVSDEPCQRNQGKLVPGQLDIPLGVGRQMLSTYDKESNGYEFYWKPNNIGAWWDKYLAVMAMGDPYTRFLGVDQSGNTRSFLINYTALYGRYVGNLVGGFLAGRASNYGPVVSSDNQVQFRDEIITSAKGFIPIPQYGLAVSIDPSEQYTAKLLIGFVAAVYFSGQTDSQDLNEAMKISVRGLSESPDVPESIRNNSKQYIEVVDPGSNRIYYATRTTTTNPTFNIAPQAFSTGYEILLDIKKKYFEEDGRTLKSGVNATSAHSAFHYINVLMGWLRAGEYVQPR